MARQIGQRLVPRQHSHHTIRLSLHPATQLQPFQQWRHPQSRPSFPESQVLRPGRPRQSQSVVQSRSLHRSALPQRLLRQRWPRHLHRSRSRHLGFFRAERHRHPRAPPPAIPRRNFHSPHPPHFHPSNPHLFHPPHRRQSHRPLRHRRRHHQHLHQLAPNPIRPQIALVRIP